MPKRIVLGLVGNDAFNGTADKNPFHFKNAKVKKLEVSINGETISTRPFEPDFTNDLYLRSYLSLYQGLGNSVRIGLPTSLSTSIKTVTPYGV